MYDDQVRQVGGVIYSAIFCMQLDQAGGFDLTSADDIQRYFGMEFGCFEICPIHLAAGFTYGGVEG